MTTTETDPVVLALRAAIATADSPELRDALGHHLQQRGAADEALVEFEAALRLAPKDRRALEGAAEAALAIGDQYRANAYRLALQSEVCSAEPRTEDSPSQTGHIAVRPATPRLQLIRGSGEKHSAESSESPITFKDVGGMGEVKQRLTRSFLTPLRNPELYKKYGKRIGGGLVLYGPPGCGKTFLARAVAGEIGARFVNVGLSDVLDMWFGESERKLHELFENARRQSPTLLFFDEVDALGQRRTHLKGSAGRTLVNQLLSELDGFGGHSEEVFFLGATNHPWDLDPALRRPGRFDRLLYVPPPDAQARLEILKLKLRERPVDANLDLIQTARSTEGFSGADLEALVSGATELAIEVSLEQGRDVPLDSGLLAAALKELHPSTRPWMDTARNYAVYANEGGVYDDLLAHLRALHLA